MICQKLLSKLLLSYWNFFNLFLSRFSVIWFHVDKGNVIDIQTSFLLLELVIPLIYWRCFYEFLEFQANSRKFILWNTKLNAKRQSLSSRNFQILPFVKIYSIKNFSNFITKIPFQTFQSAPPVMLKNHKLQTYKLQAYKKKKRKKRKKRTVS